MDTNRIVLVITCAFSGISIIISALSLVNTKKIANKNEYVNTVTASRERWANSLQSNGSCYLAIVDSIFLQKKGRVKKYEELLKYQYAMAISLHDQKDDIELKDKMQEIQKYIYKFVVSKNSSFSKEELAKVEDLKAEVYQLINSKHREEWKKQRYEVALDKKDKR